MRSFIEYFAGLQTLDAGMVLGVAALVTAVAAVIWGGLHLLSMALDDGLNWEDEE